MKKDITEIFQNYRECARHNWNTYFRNINDGWHSFINVERKLYECLVLEQVYGDVDYTKDEGQFVKTFVVEIRSLKNSFCVLLSKELHQNHTTWNEIEITLTNTELRFMDYFDWDDTGFRDYRYIRCRVINSKDSTDIIGKDILIETEYVKIYYIKDNKFHK